MNVLFVGAHPDDIEIFCGGTVARYAAEGHKLFFCVATNGNAGSSTHTKEEIGALRYEEAKKGAALVGAQLIWLNYDDEFLFDTRETRLKFIEAFRIAKPDVVFCHWPDDYNPDHTISGRIVDDCIHMMKVPIIKTESPHLPPEKIIPPVYYMDTPGGINFVPELYVDISSTFKKKVEMVEQHASQTQWMMDVFGYSPLDFLEVPARFRGLQACLKYAEAYRPSYRWGRLFTRHYLPGLK
jgi:LmbE family N-acetylglucosaminyl deacetylase